MAETKGEGIPYETEDEDNVHLLKNEKHGNGRSQDSKTNLYDGEEHGLLKTLADNYKLILAGLTVTGLIVLGVCVGALSNKHELSKARRSSDESFPYTEIRLPRNILPEKYRVYLHPNLTTFRVVGRVRILIRCEQPTDEIVLHSTHNTIEKIAVYAGDLHDSNAVEHETTSQALTIGEQHESKKKEFIYLKMSAGLSRGQKYTIIINFKGKLSEGLEGFYKSSYKTSAGEKRYIATTHFEATAARSAFPCFDEPDMKATFKIVIVHEPIHSALSNMPIHHTTRRSDGLIVDHFAESVKMSTYLVAFVICDFGYKEAKTKSGVQVRVWAPKEQLDQAEFAIQTTPKILEYYNDFFHVPFPLPKQDLIAIPDFAAGAMENWGLITYRLTSLLYDERESSVASKQWVAVVIAHELAHQWFGNLVTMKWWNDLWLNEGFAAYVEFIGTDHVHKEWKMMDQFSVSDTQGALTLDSHANSHPISVEVKNPAQINEIFDSISYDKGASIVRMMRNFLGGEAFHKGLKAYLKENMFGNAETDDLWRSMAKASGIDVKKVMDTWTLQMGYPLVTIKRDPANGEFAVATQHHFLQDPTSTPAASKFNYKWEVPLTYETKSGPKTTSQTIQWMHVTDDKVSFKWPKSAGWIKANLDGIGFYRCNYEESNWQALIRQLLDDHTKIRAADRANLIDDAFELARANQLKQTIALDIVSYLPNEREYVPWITALTSLAFIGEVLEHRPGFPKYEAYIVKILKPMVARLGWEDTGEHLQKYLRSSVLRVAVSRGDQDAIKKAKKIFDDWMNNGKFIPPNIRSTIYLAGIKYGTEREWNFVWQKQKESTVPSEQRKLLFALCDARDPSLLQRYLEWSLDSSKIRSQDTTGIIASIGVNVHGQELAWNFVKQKWDILFKRYGKQSFDLNSLLKSVVGRFSTQAKYDDAKQFFDTHELGSGKRASKQALENIKTHITWLQKHETEVTAWLDKQLANEN